MNMCSYVVLDNKAKSIRNNLGMQHTQKYLLLYCCCHLEYGLFFSSRYFMLCLCAALRRSFAIFFSRSFSSSTFGISLIIASLACFVVQCDVNSLFTALEQNGHGCAMSCTLSFFVYHIWSNDSFLQLICKYLCYSCLLLHFLPQHFHRYLNLNLQASFFNLAYNIVLKHLIQPNCHKQY